METYFKNENLQLYNTDCIQFLKQYDQKNISCVLTSPPYNTARKGDILSASAKDRYCFRYDVYEDAKTSQEYIQWTVDLFNLFDKVLINNGVILYNISYGSDSSDANNKNQLSLLWLLLPQIIKNTSFMIADKIVWKKKCALPNNASKNKLTRITQDVFVFVRKDEYLTFNCNKKIKSVSHTGQNFYENVFNYIQAKNNDGACDINKATYSSELCEKLLEIYCKKGDLILDPFNGTGTTGVACRNLDMKYIGIQLSNQQCEFTKNRWSDIKIIKNEQEILLQDTLF